MYRSPGIDELDWILAEVNKAQKKLDGLIREAERLPDSEPSKAKRIIRLNAMKREANTAFSELNAKVTLWSHQDIPKMYKTGWLVGAAQLGAGMDFTAPHREALDLISKDAYDDVATRLQQVNLAFDETVGKQIIYEGMDPGQILAIQDKSRSAVAQALLTGEADPRKVARDLSKSLWEDGITIIDGGGRHWEMETYTRMLIRTKSANAYNAGSLSKYGDEGITRVTVFDGTEDDEACAEANGQTWTLKYATEHPIEHPNCRRAFAPKPGDGEVARGNEEAELAAAARGARSGERSAENGLFISQLIRAVIDGADLTPTAFLTTFGLRAIERSTGVPLVFADDFIGGFASQTLQQVDALIAETLDPTIFTAKLAEKMPPLKALLRSKNGPELIDQVVSVVKAAEKVAFPAGGHLLVEATIQLIKREAGPRLLSAGLINELGEFLPHIRQRDLRRAINIIVAPRAASNRYGRIVGEIFRKWAANEADFTVTAWREAAWQVDHMLTLRRAGSRLVDASAQEALLLRADLDQKIRVVKQELFEVTFGVGVESTMKRLAAVESLPIIPMSARVNASRRERMQLLEGMLSDLEELRVQANSRVVEDVAQAARDFGAASKTVEATALRLQEDLRLGGVVDLSAWRASRTAPTGLPPTGAPQRTATGGRKLLAPTPIRGTTGAIIEPDMAKPEDLERFVRDLEDRLENVRSEPFQQDLWDEFATLFERVIVRHAEDPNDPFVLEFLTSAVERKSVTADLNVELLGGKLPLPRFQTYPASPIEYLKLVQRHMSQFNITGGSMYYGNKVITRASPEFLALREVLMGISPQYFKSSKYLMGDITAGADPTLLLKFVSGEPDEGGALLYAFNKFRGMVWDSLNDEDRYRALLGSAPPDRGNIGVILRKVYGPKNVKTLGNAGVNGTVYKVTDETGASFVIKRSFTSKSGEVDANTLSYVVSDWVDEFVFGGDASITNVTATLDGRAAYLAVSPYYEGEVWNAIDFRNELPPEGLRRIRLFDMLSMEADGHGDNYMINLQTGSLRSIDNEMSGGVFNTIKGRAVPDVEFGVRGTNYAALAANYKAVYKWETGDDLIEIANGVPVRLVELSDEEKAAFFDLVTEGAARKIQGKNQLMSRSPIPAVIVADYSKPSGYKIYVPAGRTAMMPATDPAGNALSLVTQNLFLSREESRKVRALAALTDRTTHADSKIVADLRTKVEKLWNTWSEQTRAVVIAKNKNLAAGMTDAEVVYQLSSDMAESIGYRASVLLRSGVLNDGAVTRTTGWLGVDAQVGEVIRAVRPDGTPVAGLVTNIYVDDLDQLVVQYIPNVGIGATREQLAGRFGGLGIEVLDTLYESDEAAAVLSKFDLNDIVQSEIDISDVLGRILPAPTDAPAYGNPRFASVPRTDDLGLQVGNTIENITFHTPDSFDEGIRIVDQSGSEGFMSWSDIYESNVLQEIIDEELALIPAEYRPREIVLHFDQLVTSDGVPAFGYVAADTRTVHLSYAAALTNARTKQAQVSGELGYLIRAAKLSDAPGDILRQIGEPYKLLGNFRELVRHELGHVVEVAIEERDRAKLTARVWENLTEQLGQLPTTREDLVDLIDDYVLLPSDVDVSLFEDAVDALVVTRVQLLEDIMNTNTATRLDEIFLRSVLKPDEMPPWMRSAYDGIHRKEQDAYHEFFAEIWVRILGEGADDTSIQRVAQELGVSLEDLQRVIQRDIPELPNVLGWNEELPAFQDWLRNSIDERALSLIPRSRTSERKLWKLKKPIGIDIYEDVVADIVEDIAMLNEPGSGTTIHIMSGKRPSGDVFAVARGPNEMVIKASTTDELVSAIERFINIQENRNFLELDAWSLGVWVDANGEITLDVSRVFDDPIDAAIFGFAEGQKAGFRFKDFDEEHYLDTYADFYEWFDARGKTILKERGVELTDDVYNAITQRVGAAYAELVPARRRELRGLGGKHLPVGMEALGDAENKAKILDAAERKYVYGKKAARGDAVVPTDRPFVITPESVKQNLETVLLKAEEEYGFVSRALPDDEWLDARNITVRGVDVSQQEVDEFVAEIRSVYDDLDRLGIKAPGRIYQPGRGYNARIDFTIESGTKMRKYGVSQIGGKVAPNGASTLTRTHINRSWRDLPGSLSRNRRETIIHEIAHHLDPQGVKGRELRLLGFEPSDLSRYASLNDDEFFAEAFLAVVTGRAPAGLVEAMIGYSFDSKEVFTQSGLIEMDRGAALRILHRFYEDWNRKYKALALEHDVEMWQIVGPAAIMSPGMTAEINRDAAIFMVDIVRKNPSIRNRDVTEFKKFLRESAESIREAAIKKLKKSGGKRIPQKTIDHIEHILWLADHVQGGELSDFSDEVAAYAIAWLARESGIMVNETTSLSMTGRYGMSQVIRAVEVLRGSRTLNEGLGNTKTRSFYNNIMDPKDIYGAGDVTVDFHMANAAAMALGMQNLKHDQPRANGMEAGLRPIIGDMVRELFAEGWGERVHADSPAELQEVIWAIWRASTDWEFDKQWFGERPLVAIDPKFKSLSSEELQRLIQRLGLQ